MDMELGRMETMYLAFKVTSMETCVHEYETRLEDPWDKLPFSKR